MVQAQVGPPKIKGIAKLIFAIPFLHIKFFTSPSKNAHKNYIFMPIFVVNTFIKKTKNKTPVDNVYFIGIGGIGMSAIARYFKSIGSFVAGYDLTESPLTKQLEQEGTDIHYSDDVALIPEECQRQDTLVIYTPAVPKTFGELIYFQEQGNKILKRSEVLGLITREKQGLCVAGTHGKTTTSSLLAHLLYSSSVGCNAFLGGISNNYHSNLLLNQDSKLFVIEADEFDRSFHRLSPRMAIITSSDPDHLDIYGTEEAYYKSFEHFTSLIKPQGTLLIHKDVSIKPRLQEGCQQYSYSGTEEADFYASDVELKDARLFFRWHYTTLEDKQQHSEVFELGVPLLINVANAVSALAIAYLNGVSIEELKEGLKSFDGVHRRFDRPIKEGKTLLIDDYAHHPIELDAAISSVRYLYPNRRIIGIFQPHLYSRTQDFHQEFGRSLSALDELILLDIYPAREEPIEGVSSELIAQNVKACPTTILSREEVLPLFQKRTDLDNTIVLTLGAGNISLLVNDLKKILQEQ